MTEDNIYRRAVLAVENGARFRVDFQKRSLKVDGEYVIRDGKYEGDLGVGKCGVPECLERMEELYFQYKRSVPSERSEGKARRYFAPLPERELDDEAMMYGERRDKAQIELELYFLCQIINGFEWGEDMGGWFWQSKRDKDLVILRKWVAPNF